MAILKIKPHFLPEGLESLPIPLLLWNQNTKELISNDEFEKIFGPIEQHHFKHISEVTLLQSRPVHLGLFSQEGRHEGYFITDEKGKKQQIEIKVKSYQKSNPALFLVTFENVNEKIELEQQLIQAHLELKQSQNALIQTSKLASLGEFSSGIAHELNQPLQAIMGFSQELIHLEKLTQTGTEFLNDIIHASLKMKEIIKSLRTFAREAGDEMKPVSVEHAVLEAKKLVHLQLLQKNIELVHIFDSELPLVMANEIQLEQVIINLISNARDAIEQAKVKNGKIEIKVKKTKNTVTLAIHDNGCGMSEEVKSKIFDPFFTTKEVGKGTGLGLSISYGILKKFDSTVSVESKVNEGSTFKIEFKSNKGEKL